MRIACVHQGYELYGSDRCFVESVAAIREAFPASRNRGRAAAPRADRRGAAAAGEPHRVRAAARAAPQGAGAARADRGLRACPLRSRARRDASAAPISSTSTPPSCSIIRSSRASSAARRCCTSTRFRPAPSRTALRALALWSGARLIFNSRATRDSFAPPPGRAFEVIYNGLDGPPQAEPTTYDGAAPVTRRADRAHQSHQGPGRSARRRSNSSPRISARACRSAWSAAPSRIRRSKRSCARPSPREGFAAQVSVEPFAADTAPIYRWADVVVAPSKLPESLGRTAIEAMAFGRPALVSAIGGLTEVVADGETGWRVPPGRRRGARAKARRHSDAAGGLARFRRGARGRATRRLFSRRAAAERVGGDGCGSARARRVAALAAGDGARGQDAMTIQSGLREVRRLALLLGGEGMQSGLHFALNLFLIALLPAQGLRHVRLHAGAGRRRARLRAFADRDARQHLYRPLAARGVRLFLRGRVPGRGARRLCRHGAHRRGDPVDRGRARVRPGAAPRSSGCGACDRILRTVGIRAQTPRALSRSATRFSP